MPCLICSSTDEPCPHHHPSAPAVTADGQGYRIDVVGEAAPEPPSDLAARVEALEVLVYELRNRVWWLEADARRSGEK